MLDLKSADVKRFWRAAEAHRDAARLILDGCLEAVSSTPAHDAVYLSGYVVECGLKALLLSRIPARKRPQMLRELKDVLGHDLERLKKRLLQTGLDFPSERVPDFTLVRRAWSSEMRYKVLRWRRPDAESVYVAASNLFSWIGGG